MAWINDWVEWREYGHDSEEYTPRKAVFLLFSGGNSGWRANYWHEIKPSPALRAALDLMEPFNADARDRIDQYELEDELVESLGYEVVEIP